VPFIPTVKTIKVENRPLADGFLLFICIFVFLLPFSPSRSMKIQLRVENGNSALIRARLATFAGAVG